MVGYPVCFKTHEDCINCPAFGNVCVVDIDEADYQHAIEDGLEWM